MIWKQADEHGEQAALFDWWNLAQNGRPWGMLLFAVPNGGKRPRGEAGKLKAEGTRPGVPDICLAWPSGGYHGLWLEMKAAKGRPTAAQKEMLRLLADAGYAACVAYGCGQAMEIIEKYLAGEAIPLNV